MLDEDNKFLYNEKELLLQISQGSRQAFTELYLNYLDNVKKYIFLFTRNMDETEEVVQDIFVKIWENKEQLVAVQSFKSYLFRSAKNRLLDHLRHQQVKKSVFQQLQSSSETGVSSTSEESVDYKEFYRIVQEAISLLPTQRQRIFRLNIEKGLSYDEIAAQLQISKSGVKNQLYKARDFVRQYLIQHGETSFALFFTLAITLNK